MWTSTRSRSLFAAVKFELHRKEMLNMKRKSLDQVSVESRQHDVWAECRNCSVKDFYYCMMYMISNSLDWCQQQSIML